MSFTLHDEPLLSHAAEPDSLPFYRLSDSEVQMGSSFGNAKCWLDTMGTGAIEQLFSTDLCQTVVCAVALRYSEECRAVGMPGLSGPQCPPARALLSQREPGHFTLYPGWQTHSFPLPDMLSIEETTFVPKTGDAAERPVVYMRSRVTNRGDHTQNVRVSAFADLRGLTPRDLKARFDADLNALVAWNGGHTDWVRVFGANCPLAGYATTNDRSAVSEPVQLMRNTGTKVTGDLIGALHVDLDLAAGETREVTFTLAFSHQGEAAAAASYRVADPPAELRATQCHLRERLSYGQVLTPDPVINDGMYWAKVNMLRAMADYPLGPAFTNSPGNSDAVVVRDSCWFVLGCDYLLPSFCRDLLEQIAARQKPDGMIIEYWNPVTGKTDDYGLSMNDNTPLFLIALDHYWRTSGDRTGMERMYDHAARAARYIVSQQDDRGLVFVKAPGTGVHGIAGWRNIIPNYQINGAVTEVNAECVAALRAAGAMAAALGRGEADDFRHQAEKLKGAVNQHLLNPGNGLYYLNIDMEGHIHSDVTVDEVFPVMFDVAPADVAYRIVNRLTAPDFSNEAGIRTVPRTSLRYHPYRDDGLLGGIWPGVTWWCAYASARYYRAFHVNALRASYQAYNRNPRTNNTVPGQFSEWFDGESMVNLGMRLSPWEAPRFVWAAVEGVCGVKGRDGLEVNPLLPSDWVWTAMRTLPFRGSTATVFMARQSDQVHLYSDRTLTTTHPLDVYERDVTDRVQVANESAHPIAFQRQGGMVVCVGNESRHPTAIVVGLSNLLTEGQTYVVEVFNSRDRAWSPAWRAMGADLETLTIALDEGGYCIIRLRDADD